MRVVEELTLSSLVGTTSTVIDLGLWKDSQEFLLIIAD
jgi:hypothetical protein